MTAIKSTTEYIKQHLEKFLLLAVCLSLCLSLRYAAFGKYVSIIEESSQAVAGECFFQSNYLVRGGTKLPIDVANWNRQGENISYELHNYSNSIKYNKEGQDLYYYVVADFYDESGNKESLAPYNIAVEIDYYKITTADNGVESSTNVELGTYTDAAGTGHPVGMLQGGTTDVNTVVLHIYPQTENMAIDKTVIVSTTALIIPLSEMNKIQFTDEAKRSSFDPDSIEGVFTSSIGAEFKLGNTISSSKVDMTYKDYGSSVGVNVSCTYVKNQSNVMVRLYYNSDKLEPIQLTGVADDEYKADETDPEIIKKHPYPMYVQVVLNAGSGGDASSTVYFRNDTGEPYVETDVQHVELDRTSISE